jgi:hypothetical protein
MFIKGTMKDSGVDITLRNNPKHILAPDDLDIIRDFRFDKIDPEEFKKYYLNLLKSRWVARKVEFLELAKKGKSNDIKLKCTCCANVPACHANLAAKFLNKLISKI